MKKAEIIGIDISKDTFDVFHPNLGHLKFKNCFAGYEKLVKILPLNSHCIMEYTGPYYVRLSMYLYENKISISIVNPLQIKRFIQMKMTKNKTDKTDAKLIYEYGVNQPLKDWHPPKAHITECKAINVAVCQLIKRQTALKNVIHSFTEKNMNSKMLLRSYTRQLKHVKSEIEYLEKQLDKIINKHEKKLYQQLTAIPGIGPKTAKLLIVHTDGFRHFQSSKQVSSFVGLSPCIRESGTSVRGRSRISKMGNKRLRNHLFMCSFTASQRNPICMEFYNRLVANGKSKKSALIAVANKLVKMAFGIAKSGKEFNPNYLNIVV